MLIRERDLLSFVPCFTTSTVSMLMEVSLAKIDVNALVPPPTPK
jgi:hypothetical protein